MKQSMMEVAQLKRRTPDLCSWLIFAMALAGSPEARADGPAEGFPADGPALQQMIDAAPAHAVLRCDPNRQLEMAVPVIIRQPLTLSGLHARLPEKLGNSPLLVVEAKGVSVTDFAMTGNADSVPQSERAPLLVIRAGEFRVERGVFLNSSKDGVMIDGDGSKDEDIAGGVIRDIVGRGVVRDVVSISGGSGTGRKIRNVLVDNVRCYDSRLRGAVEVSDGTDNITVRKVYAQGAIYAIDVQDHDKPEQSNRNVVIEDIYAERCKHALRTANTRKGHQNLTVRDITARQCAIPVQISHTSNVCLSNVRILDHDSGKSAIQLRNCPGVTVRDVLVESASIKGAALLMENCDAALVDGFTLRGDNHVDSAICFRLTANDAFSGLRITRVFARGTAGPGIVLEKTKNGTLTDYLLSANLATVQDGFPSQGEEDK